MSRILDPQFSFADLELKRQGVQLDPTLRGIAEFLDQHPNSSNGGELGVYSPCG